MRMNEYQRDIVGKVISDSYHIDGPITEEWILVMVDSYDNIAPRLGKPKLNIGEKKDVIAAIQAAIYVKIDRGSYIKNNRHTPWYRATQAEKDNPYWERYRLYLQKEKYWSSDTVSELDKTTDDIMDLLGNPNSQNGFLYRGLCVGDVQSGKTSNYIGLINKAADANYRVFILLTGTIEKLRRQTQKRINEGFIGLDSYRGGENVGVGAIDPKTSGWELTSTLSDFNNKWEKLLLFCD